MNINKSKQFNFLLFIVLFAILVRFYYLQIYQYKKYDYQAGLNSIRKINQNAPRGIIYDRLGLPLVDNRPIYDIALIPFDITSDFNYKIISKELSISVEKIKNIVKKNKTSFNRFRPQILKRHVNFQTRSKLEEFKLELPGVFFKEFPARMYPNSARLTHVLGYLRTIKDYFPENELNYKVGDVYGFSGIERVYEQSLRGRDGTKYHLIDIYGIDHGINEKNPGFPSIPGKALNLTINSELQSFIEGLFNEKTGSVICMNPLNGEVLAYLSSPDYDLNSFVGPVPIEIWDSWNQDANRPLLNRVIQGLYPPGSTMKIIGAALALEDNIVDPYWEIKCNGEYKFGDRIFHCWNENGHNNVNMKKAIKESCNIYFYHLMQKLSFKDWAEMAIDFGFGSKTNLDLYGEKNGLIPNREYMNKKYGKYGWAKGNLLTFIIGQGDILVTPLQVVQMMNLIAGGGFSFEPKLNVKKSSKKIEVSLRSQTLDFLEDSLWEVVNGTNGTGNLANVEGGKVYGKTGTAQNPHGEDHSWFAGYIEINKQTLVTLAVLVEHGGNGSVEAASISNKIFNFIVKNDL